MRDINLIVLHHSASKADLHSWKEIKQWHLTRGFTNIGYHKGIVFDFDLTGNTKNGWSIVDGRPIHQIGAHAKGFNLGTIGVCIEGNYEESVPDQAPISLCIDLCVSLCLLYKIGEPFVKGHRELPYSTLCPGRYFPLDYIRQEVRTRINHGISI